MARIQTTLIAVVTVVALGFPSILSAACLVPVGPGVTSEDRVTSLHSYAEGSTLCIHAFDPANSCALCERGFHHECRDGYWQPQRWRACEEQDAVRAQGGNEPPSQQPTGDGGNGPQQFPNDGGNTAPQRPVPGSRHTPRKNLCNMLGTC